MSKKLYAIPTALILLALVVIPVFAWNGGVDIDKDCTNVYVSADPEVYWEDHSGQSQIKWKPETVIGTGTFPWGTLQTSMNGTVTITWRKYTSNNGGSTWTATSTTHTENNNWSTNRSGSCKIYICHVAGPASDPANYNTLYVSISAALGHFYENGTPRAGHENDSLGACNPPSNTASFTLDFDCEGWLVDVNASPGASFTEPSGSWSDVYVLESVPAGSVVVTFASGSPSQITLNYPQIDEPAQCQQVHQVTYSATVNCNGVWAYYLIDDDPASDTDYFVYNWTDPFTLESINAPAFDIPTNQGELYNITTIPAQHFEEPTGCHEVSVRYYSDQDCDGWVVYEQTVVDGQDYGNPVVVDSGVWIDPYVLETAESHDLVINEPVECLVVLQHDYQVYLDNWCHDETRHTDYNYAVLVPSEPETIVVYQQTGQWTDPYTLESADVPDVVITWPDGYTVTVPAHTIYEPAECQLVHQVTYGGGPDCDEVVAFYQIDGGTPVPYFTYDWTDPYVLEDVDAPAFDIPTNPGELYSITTIPAQHFDEPQNCEVVLQHSYTITPNQDCVEGWNYQLTVPEATTSIALVSGAENGPWSDLYTLENNAGYEPTWHVVWADGYEQDVSGSTIYEDKTCLPPGDFSIGTSSFCEGNDAMVFDTVVSSPYNTEAELGVVWFYPNGDAFVTGETSLGTVNLTTGTNIFSSSLTKAELIAAIGDNNLTGGNPANDVDYDRLDLYTYMVVLRVDGIEGSLTSNIEGLWGNCDVPQREIPRCPECGPPVWEQSNDGMALVWFSTTPCVIDWENWCISITETARAWSQYMFYVEIRGELLPAEQAVGADGNTWYVLEFDPGDGNFILWGADGQGDRFRNYGPVYKYSACSVAPGWQDTTAEGFLIVRNGMNRSDIIKFLIREADAFFVGEEHRGSLAIEWVNSHLPEGPLVVGTLMQLPAISH